MNVAVFSSFGEASEYAKKQAAHLRKSMDLVRYAEIWFVFISRDDSDDSALVRYDDA